MVRKYTRQELEDLFTKQYRGKVLRFAYPGQQPRHGICNEVAFDHNGNLILDIAGWRCSVSLESVKQIVHIVRN